MILARPAVPEDWPGIEALRDECYERWGLPLQVRDGLSWLIAEHQVGASPRIVAAMGYREEEDSWCCLDWYAEETKHGIRGGSAILKRLLAEADTQGKTICGVSCFEPFIAVAMKRGFRFAGVALVRQPGGKDASVSDNPRSSSARRSGGHGRSEHAAESDRQGC